MNHILDISRRGHCVLLAIAAMALSFFVIGRSRAESPVVTEIRHAQNVHRALSDVLAAQLAVDQDYQERLESLRERGHASWLEVARQEVLLETRQAEQQALRELLAFLEALRLQERSCRANDKVPAAESHYLDGPVARFSLPGSIRLVAWVAEPIPSHDVAMKEDSGGRALRAEEAAENCQTEAAEQRFAECRGRTDSLLKIADRPSVTGELQRARLELNHAAAQLNFCRAQRDWLRSRSEPPTRSRLTHATAATDAKSNAKIVLCAQHCPSLYQATLHVAAAEAQATGELKAAHVACRRYQRRLDSLNQLHAKGFASQQEVDEAIVCAKAAAAVVEEIEAERQNLSQTHEHLKHAAVGSASGDATPPDASTEPERLPPTFLAQLPAVRHLIDLRRRRFAVSADHGGISAKQKILETLVGKLEATGTRGDAAEREIAARRLDFEFLLARQEAATERLRVLKLEEVRFVEQIMQQTGLTAPEAGQPEQPEQPFHFVSIKASPDWRFDTVHGLRYLESPLAMELAAPCRLASLHFKPAASAAPAYSPIPRRSPVADSPGSRFAAGPDRPQLPRFSAFRDRSDRASSHAFESSADAISQREVLRFRTPSYKDFYEFGIRRPDSRTGRRRTTSFGSPPWYLPGSPTNFR